ncbi:MAG: transposase [Deltaproteobacteria bacterium]|nr:transposase [Deltaproteobacteria bacterium]
MSVSASARPLSKAQSYLPRGRNVLHTIFDKHFTDFCDIYEEQYAQKYGKFHLDRIMDVGEHFLGCGDFLNGVARVRCTNPECGYDYFIPFSCKGFYLCPSCSQKRTILLAEHLTEEVLLKLPHRQFVFTVPKALRVFFRNNRKLFADISRLIYSIIRDFYEEAAGKVIKTGMVIAHQTFGDMLRWNPHFHCLVLEGGFYDEGNFVYIPFSDLKKMTEYFRRKVINLFLKNDMINEGFARNLLSWRNSGFSIDNSVQILTDKARVNLAEYISRAPVSLRKLFYEPFKGRVLYHTQYNEYFKENVHMFKGCDFLAELTQHIPPKGIQYIRRYGLYASRTRGKWTEHPEIVRHAPEGWKVAQQNLAENGEIPEETECDISDKASRKAWARLLVKIYDIDPFVCSRCGSEMRVIAVIQDVAEIKKILKQLKKVGRAPPGVDYSNLVN